MYVIIEYSNIITGRTVGQVSQSEVMNELVDWTIFMGTLSQSEITSIS